MSPEELRALLPKEKTLEQKMKERAEQGYESLYFKKGTYSQVKINQLEREGFVISYSSENVYVSW